MTIIKGKILRNDLSLYDGVNNTDSRRDSTGGTIQGFRIGGQVDVLGLYGTLTRRAIVDAIAQIGTNNATLLFTPGTWEIDDDQTVPDNITAYVNAGAVFNVASGKTLTFSGPVIKESITWTSGSGTVIDSGKGADLISYPVTAEETSASAGIVNPQYPPGNALRYGADPTGASDSRLALQTSVDQAFGGGAAPVWPAGRYLIESVTSGDSMDNGVVVPYMGRAEGDEAVSIQTGGRETILVAGNNDMIVLRWSASNSSVGELSFDSNSKTGCWAFAMVPEDMTQTASLVFQNFNNIGRLWAYGAFDEGIVLRAGPDVASADSGCFYNTFLGYHGQYVRRGIHLDSPTNAGGAPCNRNTFYSVRTGQTGCNTGIQITSGDTNMFYSASFEGISSGTSPNTTPTGLKILESCPVSGADNNSNKFFGGKFESCTRHIDNANARTELYGITYDHDLCLMTEEPWVSLGGGDNSQSPLIMPGMLYGEGLTGVPSGYWGMTKELYDWDGATDTKRQTRTLTTSNTSNTTSITANHGTSWWDQFNGIVEFSLRLKFQATVSGTEVGITLPIEAYAQYAEPDATNEWWQAYINDGSTQEFVPVYFKTTDLTHIYVQALTGGWNTAGENNRIWLSIRYRAA